MTDTPAVRQRRTPPPGFGAMLGTARLRSELTVREAARRVGVTASYLCKLETNQRVPSTGIAEALAELYRLDGPAREWLLSVAVSDAGKGYWRQRDAVGDPE